MDHQLALWISNAFCFLFTAFMAATWMAFRRHSQLKRANERLIAMSDLIAELEHQKAGE